MITLHALDMLISLMTGTQPACRDIKLPRWLYRSVVLTLPLSLPTLVVACILLLPLAFIEFICFSFADLAARMWRGGGHR